MGYLKSNDMLLPGALRFVGEFFASHPNVDVIYGHRVIVDDNGQEVGRWILPPHDAEVIKYYDWVPQETLFWRSALYQAVGGIDRAFQFAMDWDLVLRFINAGARFQRVPYSLGAFAFMTSRKRMLFRIASVNRRRTFSWPANTQGSTTPNRRRSCVIPMLCDPASARSC